jgi:hypothetical protein
MRFVPPWRVAGVDYAVGIPTGTTLQDWQTISMSGVSISGNNLNITGNNVTLNGIDFSLHGGANIIVYGSNDTIENSNLLYGAALASASDFTFVNAVSGSSNLTIKNCVVDGNGSALGSAARGQSTEISMSSGFTGTVTLEYDLFQNFAQHLIEFNANAALVDNYNVIYNGGSAVSGPHLNYLQFGNNGGAASADVEYNTTWQPTRPKAGGEGFQFYSNGSGSVAGTLAYNTMIYGPGGEGRAHVTLPPSMTIIS